MKRVSSGSAEGEEARNLTESRSSESSEGKEDRSLMGSERDSEDAVDSIAFAASVDCWKVFVIVSAV